MLQIEKEEDMTLGLTHLKKKDICDEFWSRLGSDNIRRG
jgi:hypothetical protein